MKTHFLDYLKNTDLPIVMYGTGNGAEKLYYELKKYGIVIDDFFASDSFKKGKIFCGKEVLHLEDIKKKYDKFNIVLGFATEIPQLINYIKDLKKQVEGRLIMPEVPVFGDGFVTEDFLKEKQSDIELLFSSLADEQSRKVLNGLIDFKTTGDIDTLFKIETPKNEIYKNIFHISDDEIFVDAGAYDGDTVKEFIENVNSYKKIIAFEPAEKNFNKLKSNIKGENILLYNSAVGDKKSTAFMNEKGGRNPYLTDSGKFEIDIVALDDIVENATYIKYDVEGFELAAIDGSRRLISAYPKLSISIYHKLGDFIDIPLYIKKIAPEYKLYLRHHPYLPSWETILYAVK